MKQYLLFLFLADNKTLGRFVKTKQIFQKKIKDLNNVVQNQPLRIFLEIAIKLTTVKTVFCDVNLMGLTTHSHPLIFL